MNSPPHDSGSVRPTSHDEFAHRLRSIAERIDVSTPETGLADLDRSRAARHRRQRLVPLAAAAAVAVFGIGAAALVVNSRSDTLTVSSTPPATGPTDSAPTSAPVGSTTTESVANPDPVTTTTNGAGAAAPSISTAIVRSTVDEQLRPVIVDTSPEDITALVPRPDQTLPAGFPDDGSYEPIFDWLVEWQGGFLLGRESGDAAGEFETYVSPDGRGWEPTELTFPTDRANVDAVESTGDRLLVLTSELVDGVPRPIVRSTTDLVNWSSWTIESNDKTAGFPASVPVTDSLRGLDVVANDGAWAVHLRGAVRLDVSALAADYVDGQIDSIGSSFDGNTLTLDIEVGGEETSITLDISDDLGLDADQVRALEVDGYNEMWVGDWSDGSPTRVTDLPPGSFHGVAASDGALAGWTTTHIGVLDNASATMNVFSTRREVADRSSITEVFTDGNDFIVHANAPSAEAFLDRLDARSGEWTPLDLDPLPTTVRAQFGAENDAALMSPQSLPGAVATVGSIDVGNLRLISTFDPPFTTYELQRVDTGEVILTESIDIRVGSDPRAPGWRFELFDPIAGIITDPETGEVLIDLTDEQLAELNGDRVTRDGEPAPNFTLEDFTPGDLWLVSVRNGTWLLHDAPEPPLDEFGNPVRSPNGLIQRVDDVLVVALGDRWLRFDLDP